jgi:hypothetical protein
MSGGSGRVLGHYAPVRPEHRALQHEIRTQLPGNVGDVTRLVLERERRGPRPHVQPLNHGQVPDDLVCEAVDEIFALWLGAQILERHDCNDWRLGCPPDGCRAEACCDGQCGSEGDESPCSPEADRAPSAVVGRTGDERCELGTHRAGTLVPIVRIRIERAIDNPHERARQIRPRPASGVRMPWA